MKASLLGMALAMLLFDPAMAQTSRAVSQSGAVATSASGSYAATGSSSASLTQIYNVDPPGGSANTAADPTVNDNVTYGGAYTVHNVPEVIPPSWGGQNVCAVGASGGVGVAGFGITLGGMWSDSGCERRNSAVVLYQMGEHKAAVALMCQDRHVAQAMQAAGQPCPVTAPAVSMAAPAVRSAVAAATAAQAAPRIAARAAPAGLPRQRCLMIFHYPTFPDGRPNPDGAGWMQKECG
ncbi:MAG: hypothetical protein M0002_07775 [Rhodospirillales bacterium]|nr:hypothetical protein [Rhodospirillales bacterium]